MADLKLECSCGKVTGVASGVKSGYGIRLVCYCEDCQEFAKYLDRETDTLNEFGGTEIFQIPPSIMSFHQGVEYVSCLRLSEKGLDRWFTSCCSTPIGNTVGSPLPFVGLIRTFISSDQDLDEKIGPIIGPLFVEHASNDLPKELKKGKSKNSILFTIIRKLLIWKVLRKGSPNPFFDKQGKPLSEPSIIE